MPNGFSPCSRHSCFLIKFDLTTNAVRNLRRRGPALRDCFYALAPLIILMQAESLSYMYPGNLPPNSDGKSTATR